MPDVLREMYLAGAFDTISTVTIPEESRVAKHHNDCVKKSELMPNQLAQNMMEFAKNRPDLQMKPAANVVACYLCRERNGSEFIHRKTAFEASPQGGFVKLQVGAYRLRASPARPRYRLVDRMPLAAYCDAYSRWRTVLEAIAKMAEGNSEARGLVINTVVGDTRRSPLMKVAADAADDMIRFAGHFGIMPTANSRITAGVYGQPPGGSGKFAGSSTKGIADDGNRAPTVPCERSVAHARSKPSEASVRTSK